LAGPLILLCIYLAVLLAVAWHAERKGAAVKSAHRRALVYTLSLAALCSSWTYFGAAGAAMQGAWSFVPNFLGPILAITLFFSIWKKIAVAAKRENVGSLADFLASRYGKSRSLGALITVVSMIGALPYIALQLTALAKAWAAVAGTAEAPAFAMPVIVAGLAVLAILLGARRPSLTRHNRGLVRIVAIESTVKLVAMVAVAGFALFLLAQTSPQSLSRLFAEVGPPPKLDIGFLTATLLCMVTAITLPRQFHLGFVELEDPQDMKTARWLFPVYMIVWCLAVVAIAVAGKIVIPQWSDPDTVILGLPILYAGPALTALVFLGGFSAAAAMVMIETVALSAMISNELVLPWIARSRLRSSISGPRAGRSIVLIRRAAILLVLLLGWLYFTVINSSGGLAQLGFTSLAASAQLAPALVGAVLWRQAHAKGAICGIVGGMAVWLIWVVGPQLSFGGLWPQGLPLPPTVSFEHGILASLALNVALYVGVSLRTPGKLIDRIQASVFCAQGDIAPTEGDQVIDAKVGDLRRLLEQFLGREDAAKGFEDIDRGRTRRVRDSDPVSPAIARAGERMLAGAIGASSARNVIALALSGGGREAADIGHMLHEAAQAVQFSRELLQTSLDSLEQGVCVVDREIRLVAWNTRYLEIFSHDPRDIYVGKPLEELIRSASPRRALGGDHIEVLVEERIGPIRRREPQMFERDWENGLTLKVSGAPLSSGEYVTSFTDVTELRNAARALAQSNERLEQRVQERTSELTEAVDELALAKGQAERATRSQARFVAAASHDLLQPLHAARLFLGAAAEDLPPDAQVRDLVAKADVSIEAADKLLKALLNLSRLEVDGVKPEFAPVSVDLLLAALRREFDHLARDKRIRLYILRTEVWVLSDPDLLRSVLQNLIGNAVRYTPPGGRVIVGCRRRGRAIKIEVRDSGPGIPKEDISRIFEEFARLPGTAAAGSGAGLGLAIAERIAKALGHNLEVWSRVGQGSVFSLSAPRCDPAQASTVSARGVLGLPRKLRVLCLEDEPAVLDGLKLLLERWGVEVGAATTPMEARALAGPWDVILADYQIGLEETGLDFLESCRATGAVMALVTANTSDEVLVRATEVGADVIRKPLSPASLRAFLTSAANAEAAEPT
jgi:Na+/proline symporter/signal transduction histidine kinase/CheY-like chemotaxis protein